jgi:hypothetical protein
MLVQQLWRREPSIAGGSALAFDSPAREKLALHLTGVPIVTQGLRIQ